MAAVALFDRIRIVLVEPEYGGNVGSAARALKTMGLSQLVLVRPGCDPRGKDARRLAHNAEELLDAATVADSLSEALAGCTLVVGTSNRRRRDGRPVLLPEVAAGQLVEQAASGPVALVFGRESAGLTSEELARCGEVSAVPAAVAVPSLNLAQAVMVYAAAIHRAGLEQVAPPDGSTGEPLAEALARHDELDTLVEHLGQTLTRLGLRPAVSMDKLLDKARRMLARGRFAHRDVALIHKLLEAADRYVRDHPSDD